MMKNNVSFFRKNYGIFIFLLVMLLLPFVFGLFEGSSIGMVWRNEGSTSRFIQGLGIEIFILALFALSYDILFGITGLLSFGHSMFYAVAAYATGIALKTLSFPLWAVILLVCATAILQALLFSVVLPRVKGIIFTLVSLGFASMFHIIVRSSDLIRLTGADVGLQGVIVPAFINPASQRLRFFVMALLLLVVVTSFINDSLILQRVVSALLFEKTKIVQKCLVITPRIISSLSCSSHHSRLQLPASYMRFTSQLSAPVLQILVLR